MWILSAFGRNDKNWDGDLTIDEVRNFLWSQGENPTEPDLQGMMSEADTDGTDVNLAF